jgi:cytochrome c oxidase assembly protein subunit 15
MPYAMAMLLGLTLVQVLLGTQVRQQVDIIAKGFELGQRDQWVDMLGTVFYVHRSFSAVVLLANAWLAWLVFRSLGWQHSLTRVAVGLLAVTGLATLSGATLGHLGMPALIQPTHWLSAALIFGLQLLLWMDYRHARQP